MTSGCLLWVLRESWPDRLLLQAVFNSHQVSEVVSKVLDEAPLCLLTFVDDFSASNRCPLHSVLLVSHQLGEQGPYVLSLPTR